MQLPLKRWLRNALAIILCELMIFLPVTGGGAPQQSRAAAPIPPNSLRDYLQKPYLDLFELAPTLRFTAADIEKQRKAFDEGEKICVARFKDHAKQYSKEIDTAQKDLKKRSASLAEKQRTDAHCKIQNLDILKSEANVLSQHAIPTAYDNLQAKLEIIGKWPGLYRQTQQEISSEAYLKRRWGDVKDIGFREIAPNQQDDIKRGQQAIEEMKRSGMMPPELNNKDIQDYVNTVAQQVAQALRPESTAAYHAAPIARGQRLRAAGRVPFH